MNEMICWSPGVTLEAIEKEVILKAFRFYRGNKTATSSALGIAIRTLENKLEKYQKDGKDDEERERKRASDRADFLIRQRGSTATTPANTPPRPSAPKGEERSPLANAGVRVEPASEPAPKPAVPVHERPKVQTVLPSQPNGSGAGRKR